VVPQPDYAALLAAALLGGPAALLKASVTAESQPLNMLQPLLAQVTTWSVVPGQNLSLASQSISFAMLAGWGWGGISLIVVPEAPLPDEYMSRFGELDISSGGSFPTSFSSGTPTDLALGLGMGLGLGLGLGMLVVAALMVFHLRYGGGGSIHR
jgi:hypothetical protein